MFRKSVLFFQNCCLQFRQQSYFLIGLWLRSRFNTRNTAMEKVLEVYWTWRLWNSEGSKSVDKFSHWNIWAVESAGDLSNIKPFSGINFVTFATEKMHNWIVWRWQLWQIFSETIHTKQIFICHPHNLYFIPTLISLFVQSHSICLISLC